MSRLYVVVVKRFRFFFFAYHSIFNRHLDFGYKLNQVTIRSRYMTRIKKKRTKAKYNRLMLIEQTNVKINVAIDFFFLHRLRLFLLFFSLLYIRICMYARLLNDNL